MSMKTFVCVPLCFQDLWVPWNSLGSPSLGALGYAPCPAQYPRHIPFLSASLQATAGLDRSEACPNWNHEVFSKKI